MAKIAEADYRAEKGLKNLKIQLKELKQAFLKQVNYLKGFFSFSYFNYIFSFFKLVNFITKSSAILALAKTFS